MRRAIDSLTIRIRTDAPVPATTAAGMRAHQHNATADTGRLRSARRGARVVNEARFRDACEGLEPRDIREARAVSRLRARRHDAACAWALALAMGAAVWFAAIFAFTRLTA